MTRNVSKQAMSKYAEHLAKLPPDKDCAINLQWSEIATRMGIDGCSREPQPQDKRMSVSGFCKPWLAFLLENVSRGDAVDIRTWQRIRERQKGLQAAWRLGGPPAMMAVFRAKELPGEHEEA